MAEHPETDAPHEPQCDLGFRHYGGFRRYSVFGSSTRSVEAPSRLPCTITGPQQYIALSGQMTREHTFVLLFKSLSPASGMHKEVGAPLDE